MKIREVELHDCCLCGHAFMGYGNNPFPLAELPKLACDMCNWSRVIPARLVSMRGAM